MKPYYEDESVTLYHGDCREVTDWLSADVLVTDPPYGVAHLSGWTTKLWGDVAKYRHHITGDDDTAVRDEILAAWGDRPALVFGSWKRPRPPAARALLIWDKGEASGMGDLSIPWKPSHEEIYVLGSGFKGRRNGGVIRAYVPARVSMGRTHPTEKPVDLLVTLIEKCPHGVIADPFAGSGSTLVAAKQMGRRAVGVELEERYCEIIASRLSQGVLDFGEVTA